MTPDGSSPISLRGLVPFSKGGNRFCYVSPLDPSVCLKVDQPHRSPKLRRKRKSFLARLRPIRYFDENVQEAIALADLHKLAVGGKHPHLPRTFGLVETDMGWAHATDLVRDEDGRISQTLEMHLNSRGLNEEADEAIREFKNAWLRTAPLTRELLPHNLVLRRGERESRLILIDGFGRKSVANRLPRALRERKASARLESMDLRIEKFLTLKENNRELPRRLSNLKRDQ